MPFVGNLGCKIKCPVDVFSSWCQCLQMVLGRLSIAV